MTLVPAPFFARTNTLERLSVALQAEMGQLMTAAAQMGVSVFIEIDDDGTRPIIHIPDLARDRSNASTKGAGGRVLAMINALADLYGAKVEIEHMADEPSLGVYYARFGFVPTGCAGDIINLHRLPRQSLAA